MTDNVERMRKDALGHFADASQWDMAPEDTINWQRGLNANNAADEIETLRQTVHILVAKIITANRGAERNAHINRELAQELAALKTNRTIIEWEELERERLRLLNELAALKQGQGEPVAFMFKVWDGCRLNEFAAIDYEPQDNDVYGWELIKDKQPLYTATPTIPVGYVLVPDDLLVRVSASLGAFTSDEGWRQIDMDNMDSLDALISAAFKPKEEMK